MPWRLPSRTAPMRYYPQSYAEASDIYLLAYCTAVLLKAPVYLMHDMYGDKDSRPSPAWPSTLGCSFAVQVCGSSIYPMEISRILRHGSEAIPWSLYPLQISGAERLAGSDEADSHALMSKCRSSCIMVKLCCRENALLACLHLLIARFEAQQDVYKSNPTS